ncbi:MAG: arginine--tRNA ligase [Planctomycetaceae bacterium]|nr:arginine--tRNA ligase [Planctomycetaceae bacterium]
MILHLLKHRFRETLGQFVDDPIPYLEMIRPSQDPKFGDYQANMAMSLGKKLGKPPREVAAEIVAKLDLDGLCTSPEIAGPGFINLRVADSLLGELLQKAVGDEQRLAISPVAPGEKKRYVIDYSAPNVAKPMHVGHIRSTMIGNALVRILRFYGHEVITDNHIGDWGTQFGMILYGYRNFLDKVAYEANPVQELSRLYRHVRQLADQPNEEGKRITALVLEETAKLHGGDPENLALWNKFVPVCMEEIERIYRRLGVEFDHTLGESFYQPMLGPLVDDLIRRGIAVETEGAIGIFLEGYEIPMLIRKKDGAFLYSTTDLATIQYRMEKFQPDAILYLTDFRQSLHFEQLFKAAGIATCRQDACGPSGPSGPKLPELVHVKFGTVLGEDGKPFKTRSGDTVGLESLLDEAESRAFAVLEKNLEGEGEPDRETARRIGLGALVYADLSQNRESDYVFSFDKMLAMNGNTATYMQYAYARVRSIFTKGNIDVDALRRSPQPIQLSAPQERALALELLKFDEAIEGAIRDYRPNQLTAYLYELANRYSHFFEHCPVLKADDESAKQSRLKLCDLTARTIRLGLLLLGIETVERM